MNLAAIFALDRSKLNWPLGVVLACVMVIPLVVLVALDQQVYWVSVAFGVLFVGLSDPGGDLATRWSRLALFALIGAGLTVWGIWVGGEAWALVVLSAFVVVLLSGLAIRFGVHRFVTGALLAVWFLIAIALTPAYAVDQVTLDPWTQALAWLIGAALWLVFGSLVWLARGRADQPAPMPDMPQDTTGRALTQPIVLYALLRAVVVAVAVAIAFGLHLPYADWMPVAALVAMKTDLHQSTLIASQRVIGTILGAAIAAAFLLGVEDKLALAVAILVLGVVGGALRFVNYALYTTAIAGAVLIAIDITTPTDLATEGQRILFTLIGVAIAILVMVLAGALVKRAAARQPSVATG